MFKKIILWHRQKHETWRIKAIGKTFTPTDFGYFIGVYTYALHMVIISRGTNQEK